MKTALNSVGLSGAQPHGSPRTGAKVVITGGCIRPSVKMTERSASARPLLLRCGVAVLASCAALGITLLIDNPLTEPNTLLVFLAAVMCSSWFAGLGAGLVATVLNGFFALYFYLPPYYSFSLRDESAAVRLGEFVAAGLLISVLNEARRRSEERAQRARDEAEAANQAKDNFLAMVSHELRTPLSAIAGWVHVLQTDQLSGAAAMQALETIGRNAKIQARLVEDLLDVSRIVAGRLHIKVRPIHVRGAIEAAVEVLRPAADAKRLQLVVKLDPGAGIIAGDPDRLQQVCWNLLSNAVKFTPEGGQIEVSLKGAGSHVTITIRDTGDGIAPEVLPFIFEPFRQGDRNVRRGDGLGLGLSIVRHLVELHGGTIQVHSDGIGHGAKFTVQFPVASARSEPVALPGNNPRGS